MRAKITVTTHNGHVLRFDAREVKSTSGYGNDTYIRIDTEDNLFEYVDARYVIGYDFAQVLKERFETYYGDNLKCLEIVTKEN